MNALTNCQLGEKRKSSQSDDEESQDKKRQKTTTEIDPCPVCLEPLAQEDVTKIRCLHAFHTHCILLGFQRDNRCPICRTPINELAGIPFRGPDKRDNVRARLRARGRRAVRTPLSYPRRTVTGGRHRATASTSRAANQRRAVFSRDPHITSRTTNANGRIAVRSTMTQRTLLRRQTRGQRPIRECHENLPS